MRGLWVVAFAGLLACTKPNPNRCCTSEADCTASNIPIGSDCDDGLVCRGHQCIAQPCTTASTCDEAAPYCVAELCAEQCAEDAHCPGFGGDAASLFCVAGSCAACRDAEDCTASAPYCDAGTCRPCTAHYECSSELCELDTGRCIDETTVIYVDPAGTTSSQCTKSEPCPIDHAFSLFVPARPNIKLADATHVATTKIIRDVPLNIFGPAKVEGEILREQCTQRTTVRDVELTEGIRVEHKGTSDIVPSLDVDRVVITNGSISAIGTTLDLRNLRISVPAGGAGVYVSGRQTGAITVATISNSIIDGGMYGIDVNTRSSVVLTNSILANHTFTAITFVTPEMSSFPAGPGSVRFTTFYNTDWTCPSGSVTFTNANNIFLNNAVGAPADTVSGSSCTHRYSLIYRQTTSVGVAGDNNILAMDPAFVNAVAGDFHLTVGSPAIDMADPAATESTDLEGVPRPQGVRRDMGAFEFKP